MVNTELTTVESGDGCQVLVACVGSRLCAIPLGHVLEVFRPLRLERVANPLPFVSGMAMVRGEMLPVVDLGVLLGLEAAPPTRWLTLAFEGRKAVLAVEAVAGVRGLPAPMLQSLPPLLHGTAQHAIAAVGALDAQFLTVLRTGWLLPEVHRLLDAVEPTT